VIISGGEKTQPAEVEAILRATGEFDDVAVVGIPDTEWGEVVVAAFPASRQPDLAKIEALVRDKLAAHKRPKRYQAVVAWPVTSAGKVHRAELKQLLVGLAGGT
jgi:O-succinylbenzoic acid--CoA ligase